MYGITWRKNSNCYTKVFNEIVLLGVFTLLFIGLPSCKNQSSTIVDSAAYVKYDSLANILNSAVLYKSVYESVAKELELAPFVLTPEAEKLMWHASQHKDEEVAIKYAKVLLKRKCTHRYFSQEKFNSLKSIPRWSKFIDSLSSNLQINEKARTVFQEIHYKDQLIASTFSNANIHPFYASVTSSFEEFVNEYGFPSEDLVGVNMENDSTIGRPYYHVIMLHHYHMGVPLLDYRLDELSSSGEIDFRIAEEFKRYNISGENVADLNASRSWFNKEEFREISLFSDNVKPVCEDEYLYIETVRNSVEINYQNEFKIVYLDWNKDGIFREKGVDYFAMKFPDGNLSCYHLVDYIDTVLFNDRVLALDHLKMEFIQIEGENKFVEKKFMTKFSSVLLYDTSALAMEGFEFDDSVVYFYASWCGPCIEKLKIINDFKCDLTKNFIPIALQSSQSSLDKIFSKEKFNFPLYIAAEKIGTDYEIRSFPTVFYIDSSFTITERANTLDVYKLFESLDCG